MGGFILPMSEMTGRGVRVRLLGPAGQVGDYGASHRRFTLPRAGNYTVQLDQRTATSPSPYRIAVYPFSSAPERGPTMISAREILEGELEYPGDEDIYTFQGRAGQEVILQIEGVGPNPSSVTLSASLLPVGAPSSGYGLLSHTDGDAESTGRGLESSSSRLTLSTTGVQRIRVRPDVSLDQYVGKYRVRFRIVE